MKDLREKLGHKGKTLTKEEVMEGRSSAYKFIDFDKQETLEEAAERIINETFQETFLKHPKGGRLTNEAIIEVLQIFFKLGAKWQAERMYSEKDMEAIFHHGHQIGMNSILSTQSKNIPEPDLEVLKKEWFEQFKKK